jgi:RNA polymerase sigma factor (sigma-70 family)
MPGWSAPACGRTRRSPEPAEDLLQVGYVGLLKAINNFDSRYGDSLSAYAVPCISGEIKRHFRDRRWQIRVSRQDQELLLDRYRGRARPGRTARARAPAPAALPRRHQPALA